MADRESVLAAIYEAVDIVNEELEDGAQIAKSLETVLVAKEGGLDSLALVSLIGEIEEKIEDEFDASITLANEEAMSQDPSPMVTISTTVDYVCKLIEEES